MTKNSKKDQGSALSIIVIVLAVGLVGALGFIFWQNLNSGTQVNTAVIPAATTATAESTTDNRQQSVVPSGWVTYKDEENKLSYALPEGEVVTIESYAVGEKIHVGYGAPVFLEYDGEAWQTYDTDQSNNPTLLRNESLVQPLSLKVNDLYKAATYTTGDGLGGERRLLVVDTRYIWSVYYQFSFSNKGASDEFMENFVKTLSLDTI